MGSVKVNSRKDGIKINTKYVNTPDGRKYIFRLDNKEKQSILRDIKKDWRELIRAHFESQGQITSDGKGRKWRPLSEKYVKFKNRKNLSSKILEASSPSLMRRYQDAIKYTSRDFRISISYPELITGSINRTAPPADAGVHQPERIRQEDGTYKKLGQIKRPLVRKAFTDKAKKRLKEYFAK